MGWNMACALAERNDVWVITRANNLPAIRDALARRQLPRLHAVGFDLPRWMRWWKRGHRGAGLYYYLWQLGAYLRARRLHRSIGFDVAHHLTFVKYWTPSFVSLLPIPFVWGPVGGGESAPRSFRRGLGLRGRLYEAARDVARWLGEHDPFVRWTAKRSAIALATTAETAGRLRRLGARRVVELGESALSDDEFERLSSHPIRRDGTVRFLSVGRLLHWKAFDLALLALSELRASGCEYWIVGHGPERGRLEKMASDLALGASARFFGEVPRATVLELLGQCDVLVHPSLHDSGGWVCVEAMAAGRPVICLDLGGPGIQVSKEAGVKIPAHSRDQAVRGIAQAMDAFIRDPVSRERAARAARRHAEQHYRWTSKAQHIIDLYGSLLPALRRHGTSSGGTGDRELLAQTGRQ